MELDPLTRDVAPPRHEIESDSEDEGAETNDSRSKKPFVPPSIEIKFDSHTDSSDLIVVCSQGGESYLQSSQWLEHGTLLINGEQHGAFTSSSTMTKISISVLLLRPSIQILSDQANYAYISAKILSHLRPRKLTILDDYNSALYITSSESTTPPIRKISSDSSVSSDQIAAPFESPNFVLGLAASLMNEASIVKVPTTLYLLPQSTNPHLQTWSRLHPDSSSLDTKPTPIDDELANDLSALLLLDVQRREGANVGRAIDSFLNDRRANGRHKRTANLSAMYV